MSDPFSDVKIGGSVGGAPAPQAEKPYRYIPRCTKELQKIINPDVYHEIAVFIDDLFVAMDKKSEEIEAVAKKAREKGIRGKKLTHVYQTARRNALMPILRAELEKDAAINKFFKEVLLTPSAQEGFRNKFIRVFLGGGCKNITDEFVLYAHEKRREILEKHTRIMGYEPPAKAPVRAARGFEAHNLDTRYKALCAECPDMDKTVSRYLYSRINIFISGVIKNLPAGALNNKELILSVMDKQLERSYLKTRFFLNKWFTLHTGIRGVTVKDKLVEFFNAHLQGALTVKDALNAILKWAYSDKSWGEFNKAVLALQEEYKQPRGKARKAGDINPYSVLIEKYKKERPQFWKSYTRLRTQTKAGKFMIFPDVYVEITDFLTAARTAVLGRNINHRNINAVSAAFEDELRKSPQSMRDIFEKMSYLQVETADGKRVALSKRIREAFFMFVNNAMNEYQCINAFLTSAYENKAGERLLSLSTDYRCTKTTEPLSAARREIFGRPGSPGAANPSLEVNVGENGAAAMSQTKAPVRINIASIDSEITELVSLALEAKKEKDIKNLEHDRHNRCELIKKLLNSRLKGRYPDSTINLIAQQIEVFYGEITPKSAPAQFIRNLYSLVVDARFDAITPGTEIKFGGQGKPGEAKGEIRIPGK